MTDERNRQPDPDQRPEGAEVEDLDVPADHAEDVKGGFTDFNFTKKFDKASPQIFQGPGPASK